MRILCVTGYYRPAYVYGGPVRTVSALCEGLVRAGERVTVFTTAANGPGRSLAVPTGRPVDVDGVEVSYFRSRPAPLMPFYAPALGRACRAHVKEFDVAYLCATWTYPMLAGARAAWGAGVPYVVSPMGAFMTRSLQEKRLKKRLYLWLVERRLVDRAAALRCTSQMERAQLEGLSFQPPGVVIPEGLDLTPFSALPVRGKLRASLGLSDRALLSLFVGRLAPEKRLERTVEAFARVAGQAPDSHLALVGPEAGSGRAVRQRIEALQLGDRVHVLGLLRGQDLLQAYADADLLVLLSRRENFGMVVVEAMASGLPVLLSDEVGLAEEVRQAGAGRVVSSEVADIASAWCQMLSGLDGRAMGGRGRALVQRSFSQETVTVRMRDLLAGVSQRTPAPSRSMGED